MTNYILEVRGVGMSIVLGIVRREFSMLATDSRIRLLKPGPEVFEDNCTNYMI